MIAANARLLVGTRIVRQLTRETRRKLRARARQVIW
jgi:hypothetical protein